MDFDKEFIKKLINKDQSTFNEFYLKTVDVFFRYVNSNFYLEKQEIEDAISDFYVKWRDVCKRYDFNQSFSAFVWTIFKNLLKDKFKKHKDINFGDINKNNDEGDYFEENLADDLDILDLLETEFQYKQIDDAMKKLDPDSKEVIYLKFIEEKSNAEISDLLQISNENVRQRIFRAIKKLKSLLESE